jgi:hypothetical protein
LTADNNDMCVTQYLNFFGEIIADVHCSVDELLLKSALERIFNVMQLILVKIK